ncbi:MAG: hypothetical protein AAF481_09885 [Acidobacteriota bacterium]
MPDSKSQGKPPAGRDDLVKYFKGFDQFTSIFNQKAISLLPDKELAPIITGLDEMARAQIEQLSSRVMEVYDGAPREQQAEFDRQFQNYAGPQLMSSGLSAARSISSIPGLGGVGGIAILIKKLLKNVFGISLGGFLDRLLEFIDEIFGEGTRTLDDRAAEGMFRAERRYLELQTQLARLENAQMIRDAGRGDADD